MNIIKAIGKALVLNTINNLVPGTKVKISTNSLAFCVDGRAKLYKNAQ